MALNIKINRLEEGRVAGDANFLAAPRSQIFPRINHTTREPRGWRSGLALNPGGGFSDGARVPWGRNRDTGSVGATPWLRSRGQLPGPHVLRAGADYLVAPGLHLESGWDGCSGEGRAERSASGVENTALKGNGGSPGSGAGLKVADRYRMSDSHVLQPP